jgi:HAD superfamily hydrolase (TIGR01509 family)
MTPERKAKPGTVPFSAARGFIFDLDGTLLNSHEAHYRAWDRALQEHDVHKTKEEIVSQFGRPTPTIAVTLLGPDSDPEIISAIAREKAAYVLAEIPTLDLFPGAKELLRKIKAAGKKIAIASSSLARTIDAVIDAHELRALVDTRIGLDEITNAKPDPEMILAAAAALGLEPARCVVTGDSLYDIGAGRAAGCFTVGVATGSFSRQQLAAARADLVLGAIKDMIPLIPKN